MRKILAMMLKQSEKRKIIAQILEGFHISKIKPNEIDYINSDKERITLTKENDSLKFVKVKPNEIVITTLQGNIVHEEIIDFRKLGINLIKTEKKYLTNKSSDKEPTLSYLYSTSMVFSEETITRIVNRLKIQLPQGDVLGQIAALEQHTFLEVEADYKSSIEISRPSSTKETSVIVDNYNLNSDIGQETDYTRLYAPLTGNNVIERIFSLYNGQITKDNLLDLNAINKEQIKPSAFGLKEVIGLKDTEELIIGEAKPLQTPEQIAFLKNYFRKNFNVTNVNFANRNDIVSSLLEDSPNQKKYKNS